MLKNNSVGRQWLVDIHDYPDISTSRSLKALKGAANAMGSQIIKTFKCENENERFAYVMISESHLSIDHYPKKGLGVLDMFICGDKKLKTGLDYLQEEIGFNDYKIRRRITRDWCPYPKASETV